MRKIVNGEYVDLTPEEAAEYQASMPTKEEEFELKIQQQVAVLKDIRTARAYGGFSFEGNSFGKSELDSKNIASAGFALTADLMTVSEAIGGYWKDINGKSVSFTKEKFIEMSRKLALFQLKNLRGYHSAKDDLLSSESVEMLKDVIESYQSFDPHL